MGENIENGRILLLDGFTVAIVAPDGSQTHVNLPKTSQAVELYLLLTSAGVDFIPPPEFLTEPERDQHPAEFTYSKYVDYEDGPEDMAVTYQPQWEAAKGYYIVWYNELKKYFIQFPCQHPELDREFPSLAAAKTFVESL